MGNGWTSAVINLMHRLFLLAHRQRNLTVCQKPRQIWEFIDGTCKDSKKIISWSHRALRHNFHLPKIERIERRRPPHLTTNKIVVLQTLFASQHQMITMGWDHHREDAIRLGIKNTIHGWRVE